MRVRAVTTEQDVETLRQIRNAGREWMTRDTSEISPEQQRDWWAARDPETCLVYLFSHDGADVGYGLLRLDGGSWWVSLAVAPEHRGKGHGTAIYRWLVPVVSAPIWAEILTANGPSLRAASRAGFAPVDVQESVVTMVYRK